MNNLDKALFKLRYAEFLMERYQFRFCRDMVKILIRQAREQIRY